MAQMYLLLAIATCAMLGTSSAQSAEKISNLQNAGKGYDILVGNPRPTRQNPTDAGWQSSIFDIRYDSDKPTQIISDHEYLIPDDFEITSGGTCIKEVTATKAMTSTEYRESLSVDVALSAEGWGASFKASASYKDVEEGYETRNEEVIESFQQCAAFVVRVTENSSPTFTENFRSAVGNLPLDYDDDAYTRFIELFGTHYAKQITLGAIKGARISLSTSSKKLMESKSIDVSAEAKFSKFGISADGSVDVSFDESSGSDFMDSISKTEIYFIGAAPIPDDEDSPDAINLRWLEETRKNPAPIKMELDQISELFTPEAFPNEEHIERKRSFLIIALSQYCAKLENRGELNKCTNTISEDVENVGTVGTSTVSDPPTWSNRDTWEKLGYPMINKVEFQFLDQSLSGLRVAYRYGKDNVYESNEMDMGFMDHHFDGSVPLSWEEASNVCRSKYTSRYNYDGGRLLSLSSKSLQNKLNDPIYSISGLYIPAFNKLDTSLDITKVRTAPSFGSNGRVWIYDGKKTCIPEGKYGVACNSQQYYCGGSGANGPTIGFSSDQMENLVGFVNDDIRCPAGWKGNAAWIGGSYSGIDEAFVWNNGIPIVAGETEQLLWNDYQSPAGGPDKCVSLQGSRWSAESCGEKRKFWCEEPFPTKSLELNDGEYVTKATVCTFLEDTVPRIGSIEFTTNDDQLRVIRSPEPVTQPKEHAFVRDEETWMNARAKCIAYNGDLASASTATAKAKLSSFLAQQSGYLVFDDTKRTFEEAQANCQSMGGHLASIHSEAQNNQINDVITYSLEERNLEVSALKVWLGARGPATGQENDLSMWTNVDDGSQIPQESDHDWVAWQNKQELFLKQGGLCMASEASQWAHVVCTASAMSICRIPQPEHATQIWIGASDLDRENTWKWVDDSTFSDQVESNTQDNDCLSWDIVANTWVATDCSATLPSVCFSDPLYTDCTTYDFTSRLGMLFMSGTHTSINHPNTEYEGVKTPILEELSFWQFEEFEIVEDFPGVRDLADFESVDGVSNVVIIGASVGGGVLLIALIACTVCLVRRKKGPRSGGKLHSWSSWKAKQAAEQPNKPEVVVQGGGASQNTWNAPPQRPNNAPPSATWTKPANSALSAPYQQKQNGLSSKTWTKPSHGNAPPAPNNTWTKPSNNTWTAPRTANNAQWSRRS